MTVNLPSLFVGADHGGFQMKTWLCEQLKTSQLCIVYDVGAHDSQRCDASDYAVKIARAIQRHQGARGLLICKTGTAMAMTANRFRGVRAAVLFNTTMARLAREHNDANVLALGADIIGSAVALECVEVFLVTPFKGDRYAQRRDKLEALGGIEPEQV